MNTLEIFFLIIVRRKSSNVTTLPEIRILAPSQERGLDEDTVSNVSIDSHSTNGR